MALKVQEYLRAGRTLAQLCEEHGIKTSSCEELGLVILNYDQIRSTKTNDIVRECRALTLETKSGNWEVIGRSFSRFFRSDECLEIHDEFDWSSFTVHTKEDGSLTTLFWLDSMKCWTMTTRGSFADGEIAPGSGITWEELFYNCINEVALDWLPKQYTYTFELCSRYNKVVRDYETPKLYLLAAFNTETGEELMDEDALASLAKDLHVERPRPYFFCEKRDIECYVQNHQDPTFEGVVVRDRNGLRIKFKNPQYDALHHLKNNGNIFLPKNLLPLVLNDGARHVLTNLPEVSDDYFAMVEKVGGAKARMMAVWDQAQQMPDQKSFALYVNKHTPLAAALFTARKTGRSPEAVFRESGDLLLKRLFAGSGGLTATFSKEN